MPVRAFLRLAPPWGWVLLAAVVAGLVVTGAAWGPDIEICSNGAWRLGHRYLAVQGNPYSRPVPIPRWEYEFYRATHPVAVYFPFFLAASLLAVVLLVGLTLRRVRKAERQVRPRLLPAPRLWQTANRRPRAGPAAAEPNQVPSDLSRGGPRHHGMVAWGLGCLIVAALLLPMAVTAFICLSRVLGGRALPGDLWYLLWVGVLFSWACVAMVLRLMCWRRRGPEQGRSL